MKVFGKTARTEALESLCRECLRLAGGLPLDGAEKEVFDRLEARAIELGVMDDAGEPDDTLDGDAILAVSKFIEHKGYKVLETMWEGRSGTMPIIALDPDGGIAFIDVKASRDAMPDNDSRFDMKDWEAISAEYLSGMKSDDLPRLAGMSFDLVAIHYLHGARAILRHYMQVMNSHGGDEA